MDLPLPLPELDKASRARRIAGGLAVSTAGGALCAFWGTPLPWLIGAMVAMAIAQMIGARFRTLPGSRDAGLMVVGLTLGLHFTAPVVAEVSRHWPWFLALGFAAHALGSLSAWVLARLSGANRATAYFSSMPGGAADMVTMSERYGAEVHKVAFAHSARMLLVVTLFPIGLTIAGASSTDYVARTPGVVDAGGLALLLAAGTVAGFAAKRLRIPTAFMIAPLVLAAGLSASGVFLSSMPPLLVNAAQVVLGAGMGSRFDRGFLRSAPRFAASLVPSVGLTVALALLVGVGLAWGAGTTLGDGVLAAAPGGVAEMSITAQVLHLGVAFVTAAHVIRYAMVVLLTVPVFHLLERLQPTAKAAK